MKINSYDEYKNTYWKLLEQSLEAKDPKPFIKQIEEMSKQYPNYDKIYSEWVEKELNEFANK